ncbi:MAG: protease complex subunit PrcB family protein [Elusimicrobiota bacterium]|nr:MAG: protease complex subunit PrcB family protein [Elusimicrobiota bacterium]
MKTTFLAVAALLLSVAASAQVAAKWDKIEGHRSKIKALRTVAVADSAEWEKVWREHDQNTPVPAVDWANESVVAVFLGETQNAGVKVQIVVQNDSIDANRLNVFYKEVRPATKPFAAAVVCQPYAIVKVRKAAVVAFESDGRVSTPVEKAKVPANPRDTTQVRVLLESLGGPSFDGR